MDKWTDEQVNRMKIGGNAKAREFFSKCPGFDMKKSIKEKYSSEAAQRYRDLLAKESKSKDAPSASQSSTSVTPPQPKSSPKVNIPVDMAQEIQVKSPEQSKRRVSYTSDWQVSTTEAEATANDEFTNISSGHFHRGLSGTRPTTMSSSIKYEGFGNQPYIAAEKSGFEEDPVPFKQIFSSISTGISSISTFLSEGTKKAYHNAESISQRLAKSISGSDSSFSIMSDASLPADVNAPSNPRGSRADFPSIPEHLKESRSDEGLYDQRKSFSSTSTKSIPKELPSRQHTTTFSGKAPSTTQRPNARPSLSKKKSEEDDWDAWG